VNALALEHGCQVLRVHNVPHAVCLASLFLAERGLSGSPTGTPTPGENVGRAGAAASDLGGKAV
jgi:hypothetical protein